MLDPRLLALLTVLNIVATRGRRRLLCVGQERLGVLKHSPFDDAAAEERVWCVPGACCGVFKISQVLS